MAQQQKMVVTFSPSSSHKFHNSSHHLHRQFSYNAAHQHTESGYGSGFSLSRPLESSFDATNSIQDAAEPQTTPRTTAAINYMSALHLSSTPRMGLRSGGRKGTPLKRHRPGTGSALMHNHHSLVYETTPKKAKSQENIENELSFRSGNIKIPFRTRLDRSLSSSAAHPLSPLLLCDTDQLDCTFAAISSSTPICQPFRAEFYEQQVEEIPLKYLPRSGGKSTRTKLIRKMQSFSPRKLMGMQRMVKVPLREMDQNSETYSPMGLFPVEEEEPSSPAVVKKCGAVKKSLFSDGGGEGVKGSFPGNNALRDLMFGTIKMDEGKRIATNNNSNEVKDHQKSKKGNSGHAQETSSQLLDIYVTNLSNLDGDSNSGQPVAEDGDVSMNTSMVADVERYFDELKRNTAQVQEENNGNPQPAKFKPLTATDSLELYEMQKMAVAVKEEEKVMEVDQEEAVDLQKEQKEAPCKNPPALLRKRKRPSTELIQAVLATPKKMRRSQSFHIGEQPPVNVTGDEENDASPVFSACHHLVSPAQRLGGARKRLNYEPIARNRLSPAKRHLMFDSGMPQRRSLNGTSRLNIFRHLSNCPPVRDYFFDFVEDKDLASVYAVSRQCRAMIEDHPKLNARRLQYLEAAWRKKENNSLSQSSTTTNGDEAPIRILGERSIIRVPLNNRNVDTSSCAANETMSPPVSPSRRKFHENQKVSKRREN